MLDTTVLFAGIGWPRWSYEVLRHALRGDFQPVVSPLVLKQARQHLRATFPEYLGMFEEWLQTVSFELAEDPLGEEILAHRDLMRDVKDIPIALAAMRAQVDYLVSEDKDFTAEDATTAELHKHLHIMRPVIFLREVMGWSRAELEQVRLRNWPLEEETE